jgi:phage recombination protein Bet
MAAEEKNLVVLPEKRVSLIDAMAARFSMEPAKFANTVLATCFPNGQATMEQLAAFLAVAHEYGLNPFTRELFAFPSKGGGIVPIVSVDGWVKLVVGNPDYAGMEFHPVYAIKPDGTEDRAAKWIGMRCVIYRHSIAGRPAADITEWYDECYRNTDPWNKMPRRMLRHKALKESGRYAFGFAGITDEDEARDIINVTPIETRQMEAATVTKSEALKEKIGAAKTKKTAEPAPATPTPAETATVQQPPTAAAQAPQAPAPAAEVASLFDEPPPPPVDKTPITEAQRVELMNEITKRFPPTEDKKLLPPVKAAIMKKLQAHGITATKDITASDFKEFIEWARKFEPEK